MLFLVDSTENIQPFHCQLTKQNRFKTQKQKDQDGFEQSTVIAPLSRGGESARLIGN